jgi:hypothetical protein
VRRDKNVVQENILLSCPTSRAKSECHLSEAKDLCTSRAPPILLRAHKFTARNHAARFRNKILGPLERTSPNLLRCRFLEFMRFHIHPPPTKTHTLRLQPQPLLDGRIPGELDLTARAQHTLPRQSKAAAQHSRHHPGRSWKSRRPRDLTVGRYFAARNRAYRPLNLQQHRT